MRSSMVSFIGRINAPFIALSILLFMFFSTTLAQDYQQGNIDNVYQREHSLVKPYQGSGMVSTDVRQMYHAFNQTRC